MPSHNKVLLIGRLGADPEIRYTASGRPRCSMSVATDQSYLDKSKNEWQKRTAWHRVVAWGKHAELCKQYLGRGRLVFVEGRLDSRSYKDKDGNQRYVHEVVSDNVVFLDRHKEGASVRPAGAAYDATVPAVPAGDTAAGGQGLDDDLPF